MANRLRIQHPDLVYFVTNRCLLDMFMLRPDPKVNAIILACLGRALKKHGVELIGFVFMGNHFHMLVRCTNLQLSAFMRDFESWLATKMRAHLGIDKNRRHSLFGGRFSGIPLLDDAQVFDKLIYILANPCAADIVEIPAHYPGLSSLKQHYSGDTIQGHWIDEDLRTVKMRRGRKCDLSEVTTTYDIALTPPPGMEGMSRDTIAGKIKRALDRRIKQLSKERKAAGRSVVGPGAVQTKDPFSKPNESKTSPCPSCLGSNPEQVEQYREHVEKVTTNYAKARKRERDPNRNTCVKYPPGTHPPGSQLCTPFTAKDRKVYQFKPELTPPLTG